jgi:anti-sigma-K factor RskA
MSQHPNGEDIALRYVLGELTPAEARELERRLGEEGELAAEVRRLRQALGALPLASAAEPPPALRARVLAAAERETRGRQVRPARRIVWSRFAAAVAAALALAFGLDAYRVRRELALQQEVTTALLEPNVVKSFVLAGTGGSYGRVALDLDGKRGAVVLEHLPPAPEGRIYRLWAEVGEKNVPCGDFRTRPDGSVVAQFPVPVESYTAPLGKLFVTVEAPAPSETPTGPRVMESV